MARPRDLDAPERLLESARAEFARRGLEGARVEDISRGAGLSKGAFYLHFRSKEDAFRALVQRFLGALEEQARRRTEQESLCDESEGALTARDVARRTLRFRRRLELECGWDTEMLEVLWRNRHILAAVDSAGGPPWSRLMQDFRRRMSALVTGTFLAKQAAGRLRPELDPQAVADVIVGAYEAFARRMIDLPAKPDLAGWARTLLVVFHVGVVEIASAAAPARRAGAGG